MKITACFKQSWTIMLTVVTIFCFAPELIAKSLQQAKSEGIVSEKGDGYLAGSTPEGKKIAAEKNKKRREKYQKIAEDTGASESAVARQAGEKLTNK